MNEGNIKVDYEAMLQAALLRIVSTDDIVKEYYTLGSKLASYTDDINIAVSNVTRMDIADQVVLMKAGLIQAEVSRQLRQKYGFTKEGV